MSTFLVNVKCQLTQQCSDVEVLLKVKFLLQPSKESPNKKPENIINNTV